MLNHWRLSAFYFFYFAYLGAFLTYFGPYLQSLSFSAWDIGALLSLLPLMRVLAPSVWGWLADRSGRPAVVVRLATALSLVAFGCLLASYSFAGIFLAMAMLSFFWTASLPLVETITLAQLSGRTEQYGRIRLWGSIGFISAVTGLGASLDSLPIAAVLWVSLVLLVVLLGCALALPNARSTAPIASSVRLLDTLRRGEVRGLLMASFFMSLAHAPYYVFYSIFLVAHGYNKAMVGTLWSFGVVAEIFIFMLMPRFMHRCSLRHILLASFLAAAARFLLIGWGIESLSLLCFAQLLHGLSFGAHHAAAVTALNRWFEAHHQGRAQALYGSMSYGAGGMIGGLLSGLFWQVLGAGFTYSLAAAAALIGGLVIWFSVPHVVPNARVAVAH